MCAMAALRSRAHLAASLQVFETLLMEGRAHLAHLALTPLGWKARPNVKV
jgi:hypothetical protein